MNFRARILDAAALRKITPAALRAYAVSHHWIKQESYGLQSDVYAREGTAGAEAVIPGTASIADYAQVVSELVTLFASVEERSELQVYRDLVTSDQDIVRVRAPRADDDGSVRIESGVDLVVHARDLLLAAACSAIDPRSTYRAGRMKDATEYLDRVRLGQTEHGSFVVTMLSPVPPTLESYDQLRFWPALPDDPFERQVTRQLVAGLEAAREAVSRANRGDGFAAFESAVSRGVSANLCEAAARLIERGDGLDVSVSWARTRPAPEVHRRVVFAPSDGGILLEAARLFRDRAPRPDETLEGYVVKLFRTETEDDGRIAIRALVDDRQASVNVDLDRALYETAVQAHDAQVAISITGDLVRDGHRWKLTNARRISFLDPED